MTRASDVARSMQCVGEHQGGEPVVFLAEPHVAGRAEQLERTLFRSRKPVAVVILVRMASFEVGRLP